MLSFACPQCGQEYEVEDDLLGRKVLCESCSTSFHVPRNGERARYAIPEISAQQDEDVVKREKTFETKIDGEKKYCNKCGTKVEVGARFCAKCGHELGAKVFMRNADKSTIEKVGSINWKDKLSQVAGVEKLEGFRLSALFSEVFSKHSQEEVEDYFIVGTTNTTPPIDKVDTSWPRPWVFFRMLVLSIVVYFLFWFSFKEFGNINLVPGLIIMGAFAIPFSTLIFFMEVNVLRNISICQIAKSLCFGGVISLIVSLFLFRWTNALGELLGPSVAGIVEESGKLLTVIFLAANKKRYIYKLNGLLLGAAVGTGFAVFETAGYALASGLNDVGEMGNVLVLRGLLSPFCHIVWTAIATEALWRVKGKAKFSFGMLADAKFLRLFADPVVLHMIWNSPLQLPLLGTLIIIGVIGWIIVLSLVQEGLREVREAKAHVEEGGETSIGKGVLKVIEV